MGDFYSFLCLFSHNFRLSDKVFANFPEKPFAICSAEGLHWCERLRIELGATVQQPDALLPELRFTHIGLSKTIGCPALYICKLNIEFGLTPFTAH